MNISILERDKLDDFLAGLTIICHPQAVLFRLSLFFSVLVSAFGANLNVETVKAWDDYIGEVNLSARDRVNTGTRFLWIDRAPDRVRKVRTGETLVSPASPNIPKKVPSGLIHDWIGAIFIRAVTLDDVLRVVRDYERYKDFYRPSVIASKPVSRSESEDRFTMRLANKSLFRKSAIEAEYQVSQIRLDERHQYTISCTTRIQEIAEFAGNGQHLLPEGEGSGLVWRLFGVTRFEERDGGVYLEIEAIALSRDIPASLRWFVEPIVRHVARNSLRSSLQQTRDAVLANRAFASRAVAASE